MGDFLGDDGEDTFDADFTTSEPITRDVGTAIGPYKIREKLAEGGMGVVYVAEQSKPVRRKVALKVIRPGMAGDNVVARFEAERQALAMMDHPNIARVLDGGATDDQQPLFRDGIRPGTSDHRVLRPETAADRRASGALHRRLPCGSTCPSKRDHPSRPQAVKHSGRGDRRKAVPKVIDFGVAKALHQRLTEQTVYTQFSQMVGTPLYMSPEQAGMGVTRCRHSQRRLFARRLAL